MPKLRVLAALALVCAANLWLEIALTRIFSALMFYHFAFLVIAMALLGLGASGVWVYASERFTADGVAGDMSSAARRFAASTVLALVYVLANPIAAYVGALEAPKLSQTTFLQLVLLCLVAFLPFFHAGLLVSLAVTHFRDHVHRVYAWDLAGAALGALLVGPLLAAFGAPPLVVLVALSACVAALLLEPSRRSVGAMASVALLLVLALTTRLFATPSTKSLRAERVAFDRWNTFSHVTVEKIADGSHDILIDSAARTPIAHAREATSEKWMTDITALGYLVHPGGAHAALIIGPGGGIDVARALASGVQRVTAVDVNPLIATDIMRDRFEVESGGLYRDPRVSVVVEEGRSFVRRSDLRFQVIQVSLVDTWAATASGAFALTENTLYTLEAFDDYYAHLTDDGVLSLTRWWTFLSGPETQRLTILAAGALEQRGVPPGQTRRHLYLATHDHFATLLVKKTPFTDDELGRLDVWCTRLGHRTVLSRTIDAAPELREMVEDGAFGAKVRAAPHDVSPPTDDRMFFFYFVKPGELLKATLATRRVTNPAMWLLGALSLVLVVMTVAFVFLPLVVHRRNALRTESGPARKRRLFALLYFASIGVAFMVIEVALMQRLSLLLGHPSYALVVVLFAILIGTAAGARLSERVAARPGVGAAAAAAAVVLLASLVGAFSAGVVRDLITSSLPVRMALSCALVASFGLVMGMMLPLGMRILARRDPAVVPWAWGVNGGTSVLGTALATVVAIHHGFATTFYVGAALYAVAGALGLGLGSDRGSARSDQGLAPR